jgi:hypothetical protein
MEKGNQSWEVIAWSIWYLEIRTCKAAREAARQLIVKDKTVAVEDNIRLIIF